jgi:hypothetical protein
VLAANQYKRARNPPEFVSLGLDEKSQETVIGVRNG